LILGKHNFNVALPTPQSTFTQDTNSLLVYEPFSMAQSINKPRSFSLTAMQRQEFFWSNKVIIKRYSYVTACQLF